MQRLLVILRDKFMLRYCLVTSSTLHHSQQTQEQVHNSASCQAQPERSPSHGQAPHACCVVKYDMPLQGTSAGLKVETLLAKTSKLVGIWVNFTALDFYGPNGSIGTMVLNSRL